MQCNAMNGGEDAICEMQCAWQDCMYGKYGNGNGYLCESLGIRRYCALYSYSVVQLKFLDCFENMQLNYSTTRVNKMKNSFGNV